MFCEDTQTDQLSPAPACPLLLAADVNAAVPLTLVFPVVFTDDAYIIIVEGYCSSVLFSSFCIVLK